MKVGVVVFPGSNCDEDVFHVFDQILKVPTVKLWHKAHSLEGADLVVLPGGFSYGDYLRSGAIARFSPIMQEVVQHANTGGYVWGICNGFQILCEAGLLPGALLHNNSQKFICRNTHICPVSKSAALTQYLELKPYMIPIAHGEGRFYASEKDLDQLETNDQILFKYCNPAGEPDDYANVNGSARNIAGVTNKSKNVFGMMPHPERAADAALANQDGLPIFESLLNNIGVGV
jgi:phosphoribosylformylglycinamidine synthase